MDRKIESVGRVGLASGVAALILCTGTHSFLGLPKLPTCPESCLVQDSNLALGHGSSC